MASDLVKIKDYMRGEEVELTDHLQRKFKRLKIMSGLIIECLDDMECLNMYMELTGVEQAQAYRDLRDARTLQGDILEIDRKFERIRLFNWFKKLAQELKSRGDYKNALSAGKEAKSTMGFDKPEMERPAYEHFKGHVIITTFDPELLEVPQDGERPDEERIKQVLEIASKPRVDLSEDDYTEYEEIREELRGREEDTP